MHTTIKRLYIACLMLISLACQTLMSSTATETPAPITQPSPTPTLSQDPQEMTERHQRIFDFVWRTIKYHYLYKDYNGTDWDAVKKEFTPRVAATSDDETFWALMQDMVARLDDDHSAFLTPEEVIEDDKMASGELDYVGIGVYLSIPEQSQYGVVLFPFPDSPAERAGIRGHARIWSVAGQPACCNADGSDNLDLLLGEAGTTITLTLQYPGEAKRQVSVARAHIQTQIPVSSRVVSKNGHHIGYLSIPTFWDETIAERSRTALTELLTTTDLSGLILDLRVNGGGAFTELYDLLSLFIQGDVGNFRHRGGRLNPLHIDLDPIGNSEEIPLVILIGRDTESYAEVFSGVLQAAGRATLVGQPTAGNVESVYPYNLEDGARLWLAEESFEPPSGTRWEGIGVQPDILVDKNWEDYTDAEDPYMEIALSIFKEK